MKPAPMLLALCALALLTPLLLPRDALADDDCHRGFSSERADIFHDSPRRRLADPYVSNQGRICVRARKPDLQASALSCPNRYRLERVGIFHDGPKARLVGKDNAEKKAGVRFTCLLIRKARSLGCPMFHRLERADILHDAPLKRLVLAKNLKFNDQICILTRRPTLKSNALICEDSRDRLERVGILHDSPKARLVGKDKAEKKAGVRFTCVRFARPKFR